MQTQVENSAFHANSPLRDVAVSLTVEMGSASLSLQQLIELSPGHLLEFEYGVDAVVVLRIGADAVARGRFIAVDNQLKIEVLDVITEADQTTTVATQPIHSQMA